MNSEYETTLLVHTEVRWFSKEYMLLKLYELRQEVQIFLTNKKSKFRQSKFQICFVYLVDFFKQRNKFITFNCKGQKIRSLQGTSIAFAYEGKVSGAKIDFSKKKTFLRLIAE